VRRIDQPTDEVVPGYHFNHRRRRVTRESAPAVRQGVRL
jgi:hypothetical protein